MMCTDVRRCALAYCLLPTAYCLLPTAYCLLPTAYCLLPTAYCLLRTAQLPTTEPKKAMSWIASSLNGLSSPTASAGKVEVTSMRRLRVDVV